MDILDVVGFTTIFLGLNTSFGPDDVTPRIKGWRILKPNDGECCAIVIWGLGFRGFTLSFLFGAFLDVRPIEARDFSTTRLRTKKKKFKIRKWGRVSGNHDGEQTKRGSKVYI
jgi:hypothetical protein